MKNAKRILLFALALVALTLVMSLSIFAEEATEPVACTHPIDAYDWNIVGCSECGTLAVLDEGSTNVSSNLGYKIFYATTLNDLSNTNYDVIRLKNNISLPSGGKITNANAIIDLGGNVLYRNGGWLGLRVVAAKGFVNGYVYKTNGGSQVMAVTSIGFMEDVTLAANSTKTNNATGLIMNTDGAYLGSMKNVTICAGVLADLNGNNFDFVNVGTNGIYNHGIEATKGTIGSMENVKISTYGQAITSSAKIGTMTNCVFSGDNIALNITKLQSEMVFDNCEIHSKNLAIYIADAVESTEEAPVSFVLGDTKIVTDGAVYDISSHISGYTMFEKLTSAVALVNGRLYTSLADAVNALNASTEEVTTFALIGNLAVDATIVIDKKVNFSFGGATYSVPEYSTNRVVEKTVTGYAVTSSVDVVFSVVEGGYLTISGAGTLTGSENAIVDNGGDILITAGTYVGFNPQPFVATTSCVVNNDGTYTIAAEHDYDDEAGQDKTNYQVDGVCNNCGYVRGIYAVDNVYYMTLEEAFAAALEKGKQIVLAADLVLENDTVWDLTGATFNFNALTVTGNLSIVGGNFTTDVTDYLADGYCNKYVSKVGYVVSVHNCVAGEPAEDGSITYTCAGCGETYVINNALINGEYYLGTDLVVFNNGVLSAMGGEYTYTYNVTTGMVDTNSAKINFQVIDGVIYYKGAEQLHQHVGDFTVAVPTAPTCTAAGYTTYICKFCKTVIQTVAGEAATGHNYEITEKVDAKPGEEGYIKETCTVCGDVKTTKIEALPEHTHTPVEIPAVLPTPSTQGYTAGVKCSECDETITAPIAINVTEMADTRDPAFRVASANLSLQENISVNYWAIVTEGYNNPYMVFVFNGKEYIVTDYKINPSNGRLGFNFAETFPQFMNSNIEAYVYAETAEGEYSMNKILEYSVKQYCISQLKKNDAALTTVISDVLTLGAMTQVYVGYKTNELVTDIVEAEGYTLTPTAFTGIPADVDKQVVSGTAANTDLKGASLLMGSSTEIKLTFVSEDLANTVIKVNFLGEEKSFTSEDFAYDATSGRYYIIVNYIRSYEYNEVLTATIELNGEQVGRTIEYSINTYLYRNVDKAGQTDAAKNLMKALYVYGVTIANYFN